MGTKRTADRKRGPGPYLVPALVRGLGILEYLSTRPEGATVSDGATSMKLPKPSVFRMMVTLAELGYLQREADGSSYRLGRKLLSIGYSVVDQQGLLQKSVDILRQLREITGETATLSVLSGNEGIIVEQFPSNHAVKVIVQIGHRFPLHTAAPGKALLAFLPEDEKNQVTDSLKYKKFTDTTITSKREFLEELARVKNSGVAFDRGEELEDLRCVAAPVLDHYGYPVAALCASGPSSRIKDSDLERFANVVAKQARLLSDRFSR